MSHSGTLNNSVLLLRGSCGFTVNQSGGHTNHESCHSRYPVLICLKPDYSIGWIFFNLWAKLASSNLKTSQQMTYPLFYLPTKTDTIAEITTSHLLYYIS